MPYSPQAIRFMEALARHSFLTPNLAELAGVGKYRSIRDNAIHELIKKPGQKGLIQRGSYEVTPLYGSLERFYWFNDAGRRYIAEEMGVPRESIMLHKKKPSARDYFHRVTFLEFQIQLFKHIEKQRAKLEVYHRYFGRTEIPEYHRTGKLRESTVFMDGVQYDPDATFIINNGKKNHLYTLEIHQGTDTAHIVEQLENHWLLGENNAFQVRYGTTHAPFVLSVFAKANMLKNVMERLKIKHENGERAAGEIVAGESSGGFFFVTSEQVRDGLFDGWRNGRGEEDWPFGKA